MRSVIFAALATASLTAAVPSAAFAHGGGYPTYKGYTYRHQRADIDMRAIHDKCEDDWRVALQKGNTGDKNHHLYVQQCIDRDAQASAQQQKRDERRY
jgi:hypothetical protein